MLAGGKLCRPYCALAKFGCVTAIVAAMSAAKSAGQAFIFPPSYNSLMCVWLLDGWPMDPTLSVCKVCQEMYSTRLVEHQLYVRRPMRRYFLKNRHNRKMIRGFAFLRLLAKVNC
jgi:hypothetical protein